MFEQTYIGTHSYMHTIYVASWARLLGEKNVARQCCEIVKQTAMKTQHGEDFIPFKFTQLFINSSFTTFIHIFYSIHIIPYIYIASYKININQSISVHTIWCM